MGCKGRAFDDYTGLTWGYLQEEPKAGTEMDLHDLARNKSEKTEEQVDKKRQLHAKSVLVGSLAWLCPVSDACRLSYLLIKSFLTFFWARGSIRYSYVYRGLSVATGVGLPDTANIRVGGLHHQSGVDHGDTRIHTMQHLEQFARAYACVYTGNISSALLLVGPRAWRCSSLTLLRLPDLA